MEIKIKETGGKKIIWRGENNGGNRDNHRQALKEVKQRYLSLDLKF